MINEPDQKILRLRIAPTQAKRLERTLRIRDGVTPAPDMVHETAMPEPQGWWQHSDGQWHPEPEAPADEDDVS